MTAYYVVELDLDGQKVTMDIDTGSNVFGVASQGCKMLNTGAECPHNPAGLFRPDAAKKISCADLPGCCHGNTGACKARIAYLDGTSAQGDVYSATCKWENATAKVFVGAITQEGGHFR